MTRVLVLTVSFYVVGGLLFGALGWWLNALLRRSPWRSARVLATSATSLAPLLPPLALAIVSEVHYGAPDPKLWLILITMAPLVLPAAAGSYLGGWKRPRNASELTRDFGAA